MKDSYESAVELINDRRNRKNKKGWTIKKIKLILKELGEKNHSDEIENFIIGWFSGHDWAAGKHYFCNDWCEKKDLEKRKIKLILKDGTILNRTENLPPSGCWQPISNDIVENLIDIGASIELCVGKRVVYAIPFNCFYN
jgi:hypothetical protein